MSKKRSEQKKERMKMINRLFVNDVVLKRERVVQDTGFTRHKVAYMLEKAVKDGFIKTKTVDKIKYYSTSAEKLAKLKTKEQTIYDWLKKNGDHNFDDTCEFVGFTVVETRNAISRSKRIEYYETETGPKMLTIKDKQRAKPERTAPNVFKRHRKLEKYTDHSVKHQNETVQAISNIVAMSHISKDPALFNLKLRHRIETMPERYWHEEVAIEDYIKDIDMVELPRTGGSYSSGVYARAGILNQSGSALM